MNLYIASLHPNYKNNTAKNLTRVIVIPFAMLQAIQY